jgi:hypothetical protein
VVVDFDRIYNKAIKPAIKACELEVLRGDEEHTGGITLRKKPSRVPSTK